MKTVLTFFCVAFLMLQACNRSETKAAEPVLPRPTLVLPEQPKMISKKKTGFSEKISMRGVWDIRIDYAIAQRKAKRPDLDMSVSGSAGIIESPSGGFQLEKPEFNVRPAGIQLQDEFALGVVEQLNRALSLDWQMLGETDRGTLYVQTGESFTGWAVREKSDFQEIHLQRVEVEKSKSLDAIQKWRLTVALIRR